MSQLGSYYVEFGEKGQKALLSSIDSVGKRMEGLAAVGKKLGETFASSLKLATASVTALATAGLVGTVEGNRMALAWQQLSRELAAVFLPVVQKVVQILSQATKWLRELTTEQQDLAMQVGVATVAIATFGKALTFLGVSNPYVAGLVAIAGALTLVAAAAREGELGMQAFKNRIDMIKQGKASKEDIEGADKTTLAEAHAKVNMLSNTLASKAGVMGAIFNRTELDGLQNQLKDAKAQRDILQRRADGGTVTEQGKTPHRGLHNAPQGFEGLGDAYKRVTLAIARTEPPATGKDIKDLGEKLSSRVDGVAQAVRGSAAVVERGGR